MVSANPTNWWPRSFSARRPSLRRRRAPRFLGSLFVRVARAPVEEPRPECSGACERHVKSPHAEKCTSATLAETLSGLAKRSRFRPIQIAHPAYCFLGHNHLRRRFLDPKTDRSNRARGQSTMRPSNRYVRERGSKMGRVRHLRPLQATARTLPPPSSANASARTVQQSSWARTYAAPAAASQACMNAGTIPCEGRARAALKTAPAMRRRGGSGGARPLTGEQEVMAST